MKVVLIWELNPEELNAYLIENPTEEQLDVLKTANNQMVNGTDSPEAEKAVLKLSDALGENEDYCDPDGDPEWRCIWNDKQVEFPITGPIDMIFKSGFYL